MVLLRIDISTMSVDGDEGDQNARDVIITVFKIQTSWLGAFTLQNWDLDAIKSFWKIFFE